MRNTVEESLDHIQFLARSMQGHDISYVALVVLLELGVPTNFIGFDYLLHAVVAFSRDPLATMSKGIYPVVAHHYTYDIENDEMERAIRGAIKKAWKNRDEIVWKYYFSEGTYSIIKKPTNAEFISRVGRILQLVQGCHEKGVAYE